MFAEIIFPIPVDKSYFYIVPDKLQPHIKKGVRVKVNFNNREQIGYTINLEKNLDDTSIIPKLKPILSIIDESPIFTPIMYHLAKWMSDYYITSLGDSLKAMIPGAVKEKIPEIPNYQRENEISLTPQQNTVFNQLIRLKSPDYALIHGITGSGKTEIYFKLIKYFLKKKSR